MKYVICFKNLIGIHNPNTNKINIIAKICETGRLYPMSIYGQGFSLEHVKKMGSVTEYEYKYNY